MADSAKPVVRTVTAFVSPRDTAHAASLSRTAGTALAAAFGALVADGFEVQTVRVALSPFEAWTGHSDGTDEPLSKRLIAAVSSAIKAASEGFGGVSGEGGPPVLLTVGPASSPEGARAIPDLVRAVPGVTASLDLGRAAPAGSEAVPAPLASVCPSADPAMSAAAARVMAELATSTPDAAGNFSFAALARVPPMVPFFPAAYAPAAKAGDDTDEAGAGPLVRLAVGLQHLNVTVPAAETRAAELRASGAAPAMPLAAEVASAAAAALLPHVRRIEALMDALADGATSPAAPGGGASAPRIEYAGLDSSFAPSPAAPSLSRLFRAAGVPHPGAPGSVALASALTAACKSLGCPASARPRLLGYCGLMLPPLEDTGLAEAVERGQLHVPGLLSISSVCGIGLDTVPVHVPGLFATDPAADAAEGAVEAPLRRVIEDVAALAYRLGKPLSCRLFPHPAEAGEATTFDHPYMCNTTVMRL